MKIYILLYHYLPLIVNFSDNILDKEAVNIYHISEVKKMLKKNGSSVTYIIIFAVLFFLVASLFSFYILQSDDYYYASFFKDGIVNFCKLTLDHYRNVNGRVLVHFFAHCSMAFPTLITGFINLVIVFLISHFFSKIITDRKTDNTFLFYILFLSGFMLLGRGVLKEAVMWLSGFYNYVFPLFIIILFLFFKDKSKAFMYSLAFLSGATTEQWGFGFICMLCFLLVFSFPKEKTARKILIHFSPAITALLGYMSIYLSPATLHRASFVAHREPAVTHIFSAMAKVFFDNASPRFAILFFVGVTIITAFVIKNKFKLLYTGFILLAFILFSPFFWLTFLCFVLYMGLVMYVLISEKHHISAMFLTGVFATMIIMLPVNTFEYRITFAPAVLMLLSALSLLFTIPLPFKITLPSISLLALVSVIAFLPSYLGFYRNHMVEKENLEAIKEAKETKVLNFSIDYNKDYAMRQMFNDGWFYKEFLSLYNIEDCTVYLDSKDSAGLLLNGKNLNIKALKYNDEYYIPMRQFLHKAGGSIKTDDGVVMTLNSRTLSYINSAFVYTDSNGECQYLIADENKLFDWYTLYIKLTVVKDAFGVNLTTF